MGSLTRTLILMCMELCLLQNRAIAYITTLLNLAPVFSGLDDTTGSGSTELTELVDKLVYRTEQDKNDGVYGAEQWLELHLKYKEKLNKK